MFIIVEHDKPFFITNNRYFQKRIRTREKSNNQLLYKEEKCFILFKLGIYIL